MCQREYLISRIFKLFLVLLNRAYFPRVPRIPRIPRISQVFQLLLRVTLIKQNLLLTYLLTYLLCSSLSDERNVLDGL